MTQPLLFTRKSDFSRFRGSDNKVVKNVILVSLDWRRIEDGKTSLGMASIAAALSAEHIEVEIIEEAVNHQSFSLEKVLERLLDSIKSAASNCMVGFGVFVWNDTEVRALVNSLHTSCSTEIVLGGPQISYMRPGDLEEAYPGVDYFVRGQGEIPMVELATGGNLPISGVHVPGTFDNGTQAEFQLEQLPSPFLNGMVKLESSIRWETQRGCPFKCSFCQHREPGNRLRSHWLGTERLDRETEMFANADVERISVLDPIFHANPERAIQRLNVIQKSGLKAQLSLQCRFEMVTPEFLDALDDLNVTLEFGIQTIIPEECKVIGRPNNISKIEAVVKELKERSLDFEISLIYGLPLQTLSSFKETIDWCVNQDIPRIRAWPLMLLRGTPLYEHQADYGFKESAGLAIPIVIASNTFTESEYLAMADIAATL